MTARAAKRLDADALPDVQVRSLYVSPWMSADGLTRFEHDYYMPQNYAWAVRCRKCQDFRVLRPTWRLAMETANRHAQYHLFSRPR